MCFQGQLSSFIILRGKSGSSAERLLLKFKRWQVIIQMVFESLASILLNKYLQKIFFGISSKNIQFSILDGKFVLSNIGLQPSLITNLNLPIQLRYSYVERVEIHIPWRQDQVLLTINMSNIYLLVTDAGDNFDTANIFMKGKEAAIQSALKQFKANLERQSNKQLGFFQKLLLNLLDNVNIKIECIHVRYENKQKNYSFGIKINEVSARTVNSHDELTFFNRDRTTQQFVRYVLEMDFMGIYFNSKEDYFLSNRTSAEITNQFNRISNVRTHSQNVDYQDNLDSFNYILTISLKTYLKKYINALEEGLNHDPSSKERRDAYGSQNSDKDKYLFECDIKLNKIQSRVTHEQYEDIMDLINVFSQYQRTYQQYANQRHFINYREKRAKDIVELIHKKNKKSSVNRKEKELLSHTCQKYFTWIFRTAYQEVLKRRFIKQAIKDEITVESLQSNKKITRIMQKIQNDKLKYWILIALYNRKKYEDKVNVLLRGRDEKKDRFAHKYIDSHQSFEPIDFQQQINRIRQTSTSQFQVFLKLNLSIQQLTFEISKESVFGVSFNITKMKSSLIVRQKNYQLSLIMDDFAANVFNCKKSQKLKTYVPIIRRNAVYQGSTHLLEIKYERNPIGKPFVFTQAQINFESIQITIYPEAFRQFYQILLGDKQQQKKTKTKGKKKPKQVKSQGFDPNIVKHFKLQKTIIKGKVKSPWVVLPLSTNNDMSKDCWVVRLGDFYINVPQNHQSTTEEQLYYQQYRLELKRFELNYFSSIHFFHNWQKYNYSMESLYKINAFKKEKKITMIQPFSCLVDFSMLRSNLPESIRNKKHRFVARINLDEINIKISKFLLTKMKYRFDVFDQTGQQLGDFIQTNITNMREQNQLSGYCRISHQKIKKVTYYCILKDNFMYFFINQQRNNYHFFVDMTSVAIRFVSNQVQNINPQKGKLICFYFNNDRQKHQLWKKKIMHIVNRKERKFDTNNFVVGSRNSLNPRDASFLRDTSYVRDTNVRDTTESRIIKNVRETQMPIGKMIRETNLGQSLRQPNRLLNTTLVLKSQSSVSKEEEQAETGSSSLKVNLTFFMNKLSIQLLDEKEQQFLDCMFLKVTFVYEVLRSKVMNFALNQWIVTETDKNLPFASSTAFFSSEMEEDRGFNLTNFLEIRFIFNEITQELESILIDVDKLFLAWKVQLFTKILLYFFFEEQVGDAPSPVSYDKKQLQIIIKFQKLIIYAYFNEELIALSKMQFITLRYFQNNLEQSYDFKCKIFEMDKYVKVGPKVQRLPMIKRKDKGEIEQISYNNFDLYYLVRKKQTQNFTNITRLKKKLGEDTLVSQIFCNWNDTVIYFQNQLTFRLLNYILGKILGTIASKFKKKQYSPNYIFQSLKHRKVTVFDVKLHNFQFRMPPHQRDFRQLTLEVNLMHVSRNIDDFFMPSQMEVPTIRHPLKFLWESMIIQIKGARMSYCRGQEPPIPLHKTPFGINIINSKLNFSREYFVILKHHDDIDRKNIVEVIIEQPVIVDAHKIMFTTFLQFFYQNMKHKDGLAQKFQPSLPFPSIKEYNIHLKKVGFNMHAYNQQKNKMEMYSQTTVDQLKISYNQYGYKSNINISFLSCRSQGELPIYPLDKSQSKLEIKIQSDGPMRLSIDVQHYALEVNLDNLGNVIDFIDFDSQHVSNKIMPKKQSTYMYVNVFAKNCILKLGDLHATGQFYISYLKGMKNQMENQALKYLLTEQEYQLSQGPQGVNWRNVSDKEIKVNGNGLKLSIRGDYIGQASNMCFSRIQFSNKTTNRRFKREKVQVGEGALHIQPVDLTTIFASFNEQIRKSPKYVPKAYYQPWDKLSKKQKSTLKRCTEVQIQKLAISIIPTLPTQKLLYGRIDLSFPLIQYKTYLVEEQILVHLKFNIFHNKQKLRQTEVASCKTFKLKYTTFKDRKEKWVQIIAAKNVKLMSHEINDKILADVLEESKKIQKNKRKCLAFNSQTNQELPYEYTFRNQTNHRVTVQLSSGPVMVCQPFSSKTQKTTIRTMLQLLNHPDSFISLTQNNNTIKKYSQDINLYGPTQFTKNVLTIHPQIKKSVLVFRPPYQLFNKTPGIILLTNDKKIVKQNEKSSLTPTFSTIQLEMKIGALSANTVIDIRKEHQLIGQECFVATVHKKGGDTLVTVQDRYAVKNMLPVAVVMRGKEIAPCGQLSLGYLTKKDKQNLQIKLQNASTSINISKQQKKATYQKTILINSQKPQYHSVSCQILLSYTKSKGYCQYITLYCQHCLRNNSQNEVFYSWGHQQFILLEKESTILPGSFSNLSFIEKEVSIPYTSKPKDKHKSFYGKYLQFTSHSKLNNKMHILKIQPKYTFINNSSQTIEIKGKEMTCIVAPYQLFEMNQNVVNDNNKILVVFGKYHKKEICLSKLGVNYLEMEQIFFKINVAKKEQSVIVMLQDSKNSHKIINKINDLTITACSYFDPSNSMASSSQQRLKNSRKMKKQLQNQDCILKLIKPNEQNQVGLFNWNNPTIELQFYYDSKNIQFKQRFIVDFNQLDPKYSIKHILHQEKDKEHKIIFVIVLTFEKDKEGRYTITAYKEKQYQSIPFQKLKFNIHQISCSFALNNTQVTLECYKIGMVKEKGAELQDIDLQVEKILIRQGKNMSILSTLNNSKFLNCHLILNKTLRGTCINNLMVKTAPLELMCREKVIFMILEKIVQIRAEIAAKGRTKSDVPIEQPKNISFLRHSIEFPQEASHFHNGLLQSIKERMNEGDKQLQLSKDWKKEVDKLIKGQSMLVVNNLVLSETSIFVSYSKEEYRTFDDKIANDPIIKYMLLIPSISELKVAIPHLRINDFEGQPKTFAKQLLKRLRQSIGATVISSFSSLPLFDNPIIAADGIFKYIEGILSIQ